MGEEVQQYAWHSQAGHLELCLRKGTSEQVSIPFQIILRMMEEHAKSPVTLRKKKERAKRQAPMFRSWRKTLSWSPLPTSRRLRVHRVEQHSLPEEIWMKIFQHLSYAKLCEIQLVCTHW